MFEDVTSHFAAYMGITCYMLPYNIGNLILPFFCGNYPISPA